MVLRVRHVRHGHAALRGHSSEQGDMGQPEGTSVSHAGDNDEGAAVGNAIADSRIEWQP
jgi:hypothetical protein